MAKFSHLKREGQKHKIAAKNRVGGLSMGEIRYRQSAK
jgi:hypothetical protein